MSETDQRYLVAVARRILARAGLDPDDMAGQVALRSSSDPACYWTSPMQLFEVTAPGDVVLLPIHRGTEHTDSTPQVRVDAGGPLPVSTASNWVGAILAARPDATCLVHTHAPYIGAVATTGEVVGLYNNRSLIFYGDQALFDSDGTDNDDPAKLVAALGTRNVLIQRNHGAVVVGESVEVATMRAVLLERAAQFHVLARSVGGTPFPNSDALIERRRLHLANLPLLWDAHIQRLRRTDPELFA